MPVQDYQSASDEQRSLILSQAELRLGDQHAFAQAADARAATVTSAAAALATASVGAFAVSLAEGPNWALAAGALVAAIGVALSTRKALASARCREFHPKGYRPSDLAEDITMKLVPTPRRLLADRAYDARKFRDWLIEHGSEPVIPANPTRKNPSA